jgi:hypothetical protein
MLKQLEPEARREMSNLLYRQQYEQRNYDALFVALDPAIVSDAGSARVARARYGTGGGRIRRPQPPDDY